MVAVFGAALEPIACPTCDGTKEIQFKTCTHGGRCPCDTRWTRCPDCLRFPGLMPCTICWDEPAIGPDADGDMCGANCLAAEADEMQGAA